MINVDESAAYDYASRIIDVRPVSIYKSDDHNNITGSFDDAVERATVLADEIGAQQQIFRGIARQGKLWKGDQVCSRCPRTIQVIEHKARVTFKIADGRIDLRKRNSDGIHGCPSSPVSRFTFSMKYCSDK
jgi:hypothetical protein